MTSDYKNATIKRYAASFSLSTFVETGTCYGDALAGVRDAFTTLYSIELSPYLHELATTRFYGDEDVHLYLGDSAEVLPTILQELPDRCLFWLDAHYSGGETARGNVDTPIMKEVESILTWRPHGVILIDDADCFNGNNAYPKLEDLERYVKANLKSGSFLVEENIIRIYETVVNI